MENKKKMFIVCGKFTHENCTPRESKIGNCFQKELDADGINGGNLQTLNEFDFRKLSTLIWMPEIDNNENKIVPRIKIHNPKLFLITSKRMREGYTLNDFIGRLLQNKSNLGIAITKESSLYRFKLIDPLGNIYVDTLSVSDLAKSIKARVEFLNKFTRLPSKRVGSAQPVQIEPEFLSLIKSNGTIFNQYVKAVNPNRLLGNASTRCAKGFPTFKQNKNIYVTRRNVEKSSLNHDDFVRVSKNGWCVDYYGDYKPSVDTPLHLEIFEYYKNIKYIQHGHVYVKGAPLTLNKIPCGYVESFKDIVKLVPSQDSAHFVINLRGHGCLICSGNLQWNNIVFEVRPFPEGEE